MSDWLIWPIGIGTWLATGWLLFAYFEDRAIRKSGDPNRTTLSNWVYTITKGFPLLIFVIGLAVGLFWGGLGVHFWWHWCPAGSVSQGLLFVPAPQRCHPLNQYAVICDGTAMVNLPN